MMEMWVDVDTAITVPVNLISLIDDTDFKTRETGIVYNESGMDLVWNFQTTDGVTSQTPVTPTTSGDYDWTHSGDGIYKIEIPASGGASINNDTEGFGWFTGICDGVLAWRSPVLGFRAAALNNALIDNGNIIALIASDVWDELLTGSSHNIATSAGRRLRAIGDVVSGSVDDASATTTSFITDLTGVQPDHYADQTLLWTSGNLAGMSRSVLSYDESTKVITIEEALPEAPANGDDFDINPVHIHPVSQIAFEVWEELLISGTHNVSNSAGKRLRDLKESALYEGGFIYYDSVDGQAGDEAYVNGTLANPVNNETDLLTLKAALNISSVKIRSGSTLTLTAAHEKQEYIGESWALNLGGQSISGSFFHGANSVNGIATGPIPPKFEDCIIENVTVPPSRFYVCGYSGTMTAGSAGDFFFISDSHSGIAGVSTPSFDYGAAIGATNFNFRGYHGGQNIENMKAGDNLSFDGDGQITIAASSVGGVMRIAGHQRMTGAAAFISAGGTIVDDARFAMDQIVDNVVGQGGDTLESLSDQIDGITTGGINVVSALDGTVQAKYASDGGTVEVVRGDTVSIPYDLTVDLTAKKLYFAAKKQAGDTAYMIDVTDITASVTDAAEGQGVIPLTSDMLTGIPPQTYDAEMEMRDGDGISNRITVLKFKMKVVEQVIVFSSSSSSSSSQSSSSQSSSSSSSA